MRKFYPYIILALLGLLYWSNMEMVNNFVTGLFGKKDVDQDNSESEESEKIPLETETEGEG